MKPARRRALDHDILVVADCGRPSPRRSRIQRAIDAAAAIREAEVGTGEVAVVLADDAAIRALNKQLAQDRQADQRAVVSAPRQALDARRRAPLFGDIAIAYETAQRGRRGRNRSRSFGPSAVHGFLHLMGYDHETDAEAETMEAAGAADTSAARPARPLSDVSCATDLTMPETTPPTTAENTAQSAGDRAVDGDILRAASDWLAHVPRAVRLEARVAPRRPHVVLDADAGRVRLFAGRAPHAQQHPRPARAARRGCHGAARRYHRGAATSRSAN